MGNELEELITFEKDIEELYKKAQIKAPIHLSGGNEEQLIEIFRHIKKDDWVFSNYRNHYHALLKGIPSEWLKQQIIAGRSMHIMNKEHKFFATSIVPGQLPIALGMALALKLKNFSDHVWAFCGDMGAETGVFHEVTKYAAGHNLPITFIVESDGLSVYTPTQEVWGTSAFSSEDGQLKTYMYSTGDKNNKINNYVKRYSYKRQWPHHGIGIWVEFPGDEKNNVAKEKYKDKIKQAMEFLAEDDKVIFIGQTVGYKGSPIYESLVDIIKEKRIELPIMEEVQMGISTGLALGGYIPVSIYPRFDFLILATNQLVNHLDKISELSHREYNPKVIIRTAVGSKTPIYPCVQHCQDHTEAFKSMLTNIDVIKLMKSEDILPAYKKALESKRSTLLVEMVELYNKR